MSVRGVLAVSFLSTLALSAVAAAADPPDLPEPAIDPSLFQGMEWRQIGPYRGGRSNASIGVPGHPLHFYFGGVGSGVWKTTDGGESWANVSDETFGTSSVGAITVAPSDPNVVWVGMGEHAVRGVMTSHGDGVYRSTDAGKSWTHLGLDDVRQISAIVVHPDDPDVAWVAAQGAPYGPSEARGIYRTRDGGASWDKVLYVDRTAGASGLAVDPSNPRILYAAFWDHLRTPWEVRSGGPGSGVWKSSDGGDSWKRIGETVENGFPELKGKMHVAVAPDGERLWALVEADPGGGLYRSEDAGESWKLVNEDWGIRARAWYYIKVWADPTDRNRVWITNARLYKSIDGGESFETVRVPHGDNHHLWIDPDDPQRMINSNDGGANVSYNGGASWTTQANQPTAQFYRVNVDNQFPFHVYGGQQDNSAIAIASAAPGGIGREDFYSVAGCETAWAAFDPDDPEYVYGGCYMGLLEEWRRSTGGGRDVMAYPVMPAALASRDMKYRFNWSAPVITDPHDRSVIYHAGNVVLRSDDRGVSWTEISPDLTRDDDEKQGPGGGPITNEGAGGEIYGTIYTLVASPHESGVLWAGSDDGLVHVTRDGGESWSEVTPRGVGEALVNAIEVSPHDPARAYVAASRYKFNDFTPMAYRTEDFGATWTSITDGIPQGSWVRVVREDPVRPGLLYMGTETGPFVSFDDGRSWQSLGDLPVTPITDLIVHERDNDLVAATSGRGFWILDDLSPLQQMGTEVPDAEFFLFEPEAAVRAGSGGFRLPSGRVGQNPPGPATLDFVVAELPEEEEVRLEIYDESGNLVREFVGDEDKAGQERPADDDEASAPEAESEEGGEGESSDDTGAETSLEKAEKARRTEFALQPGHNRVAWDLEHRPILAVPGLYVFGSLDGRRAVPGRYEVRLTVGEETLSRWIEVKAHPAEPQDPSAYRAQDELAASIAADIDDMHRTVLQAREVRGQIDALLSRLDEESQGELIEEGRTLAKELTELEDALIQKRVVDGQTVINFPMRLDHFFLYLHMAVAGSEGLVNDGARERYADLTAQWQEQKELRDRLFGEGLDTFNQRVRESAVPAVAVP